MPRDLRHREPPDNSGDPPTNRHRPRLEADLAGGHDLRVFLRHRRASSRRETPTLRRGRRRARVRQHRRLRARHHSPLRGRPPPPRVARRRQLPNRVRLLARNRRPLAFPGPLHLEQPRRSPAQSVPLHRPLALPPRRNRPRQRHRPHPARQRHRARETRPGARRHH